MEIKDIKITKDLDLKTLESYMDILDDYFNDGHYGEVVEIYNYLSEQAYALNRYDLMVECVIKNSYVNTVLENYEYVSFLLIEAVSLSLEHGFELSIPHSLIMINDAIKKADSDFLSIKRYKQLADVFELHNIREPLGRIYFYIANAYLNSKDKKNAKLYVEKGLDICKEYGDEILQLDLKNLLK